jgi:hypothetical protein
MRVLVLLLCVALAGCTTTGQTPTDIVAAAPAPAAAPPAAAGAPAARAPRNARDATEAKVICWGRVEREKRIKSIDQRIAFVDKCVADELRAN